MLELIIALAISAIMIGLAVPSMQSFMGDSEISSTSNHFVYSLQTARSEAIKRAGPVALCPSAAPLANEPACDATGYSNGWIVFADANGNGSRENSDEVVLQSEGLSPAFNFTPDKVFSTRVYFNEFGGSVNPAGVPLSGVVNINYTDSESRTVSIAANGRISTSNPDTAGTH